MVPIRRSQVHRTHGQVIAVRAGAVRAALSGLPEQPYLVTEKHLRRVGTDALGLPDGHTQLADIRELQVDAEHRGRNCEHNDTDTSPPPSKGTSTASGNDEGIDANG